MSWGLSPLERQVGESSSSEGMMLMRDLGDLETGKVSTSRCSSAAAILDFVKAVSFVGTDSDAEVTHGMGNRDSGFTDDMVVSSATAAIEAPILKVVSPILGWHPWVVQNRFSPLLDLGNGVEDEFVEGEDHEEE